MPQFVLGLNNVAYVEHLFPFWEPGTLACDGTGCLCEWCPVKSLMLDLWCVSPDDNILDVSPNPSGEIKCLLCNPTGRGAWELVLVSPELCVSFICTFSLSPVYPPDKDQSWDTLRDQSFVMFARKMCLCPPRTYCSNTDDTQFL